MNKPKEMMNKYPNQQKAIGSLAIILVLFACQKEFVPLDDPYGGGKEPFGISFTRNFSYPEIAEPGDRVTYYVKGLKPYEGQYEFLINDQSVEVVTTTDSTVEVVVPEMISSGAATIKMENQFFNGPVLYIDGQVSVDENFNIVTGFDGLVTSILPQSGGHIIGGLFTDFENEASETVFRNGIHYINSLGESDGMLNFQEGVGGYVNDIAAQANKYYLGGSISTFNERATSNVTRLNADGTLDSMVVEVLNPDPNRPENGLDTVPAFNGGTLGGVGGGTFQAGEVLKVFPVENNNVILLGSFYYHQRIDYRFSSRETRRIIRTPVRNVMRMKEDGSLDSTYMMGNAGANGAIYDGTTQGNGKVVIVGDFTTFNGRPANRIVRLNADGSLDESFGVGSAADDEITGIQYNPNIGKMIVFGRFTSFNGIPVNGVAVLNESGDIDPAFQFRVEGEGTIWKAHILNGGKILVSHSYAAYDGIKRASVLILEPDGTASQRYNNIGVFGGIVESVVETTSSLGNPAVLLGGLIAQVEQQRVGGIVKLEIRD